MTTCKSMDAHLASKLKKIAQAKYKNEINDAIVIILDSCKASAGRGKISVKMSFRDAFGDEHPEVVIIKAVREELNQRGFIVSYTSIAGTFDSALKVSWQEA